MGDSVIFIRNSITISISFLLLYGSAWFCNIFVSAFYIFGSIYKEK